MPPSNDTNTPEPAPAPAPKARAAVAAEPEPAPLALEEFCATASLSDKRVELLSGFYASEKSGGRLRDTAEAYAGRLEAFGTAIPRRGKKYMPTAPAAAAKA